MLSRKQIEQVILALLFLYYLLFVSHTPAWMSWLLNNYIGIVILIGMCFYLYKYTHPFLFVLGLVTSLSILYKTMYGPDRIIFNYSSQAHKDEEMKAMNPVSDTLEQEIIHIMLPNSKFFSTPEYFNSVQPHPDTLKFSVSPV